MIARTEEGFRLENAIAPHPPPDCPTTMAFPGVTIPSPSMKSINDCQSRSPKVRIVAVSNAGKEEAMMSALRHINGRRTISDGRNYNIAVPGEPERCITKFDQWKKAALFLTNRNSMVHDG